MTTAENELLLKIQQLEIEMSKKDESLDELRRDLDVMLDELTKEKEKNNIVETPVEVNTDNSKQKMLESTLINLRKELTQKNQLIDELTQKNKLLESREEPQMAVYLKGSNLNDRM